MSTQTAVELPGGVTMPALGFGVFQVGPGETVAAVREALAAGYRHVDTAQSYGNEAEVGEAIAASGLLRAGIFLTTKLHRDRFDAAAAELDASLARLGVDHVDLFLLHWPSPPAERYLEAWAALEELRAAGKARAIGVSNLDVAQLAWLAERSDVTPAVNQVELHPWHSQPELRAYHAEHGIVTQAWRPIAKGTVLGEPTVVAVAERAGRTPAQVVLRWQLQLGLVPLPKSVTPARIRENAAIFDFELADADMAAISALHDDPGKPPSRMSEVAGDRPMWRP
jgi:2,5-diketo-D-gluconate reductase A